MLIISDSQELAAFCARLSASPVVTIDTEFMREKTYYPQLCLVQLAGPEEARAVDPLAEGLDLAPLFDLLTNPAVLKVFHSARQDIELFIQVSGRVPSPLFDTQVAAMACGFGDSASYETLAYQLAGVRIDKSMRFTDWALRPLTPKQVQYALADVTHLRVVHQRLVAMLEENGRTAWLDDDMAALTNPSSYQVPLEDIWRRLRPRSSAPRFLAVLQEVAIWRELEAQQRNLPRQHFVRDEALLEVAAHHPSSEGELDRVRGLSHGFGQSQSGQKLLAAVQRGLAAHQSGKLPLTLPERVELPRGLGPVSDLLKVLLKMKCDQHGVAQKLVASAAELDAIVASDEADVPALQGWRRALFGADALRMKHGQLGIGLHSDGRRLRVIPLGGEDSEERDP